MLVLKDQLQNNNVQRRLLSSLMCSYMSKEQKTKLIENRALPNCTLESFWVTVGLSSARRAYSGSVFFMVHLNPQLFVKKEELSEALCCLVSNYCLPQGHRCLGHIPGATGTRQPVVRALCSANHCATSGTIVITIYRANTFIQTYV